MMLALGLGLGMQRASASLQTFVATRTRVIRGFGSSTMSGTGASSTTDVAGRSVAAQYQGVSIGSYIGNNTLPAGATTSPIVKTDDATGGGTASGIRDSVQKAISGTGVPILGNADVMLQFGGNFTTSVPTVNTQDKAIYDELVTTIAALDANGNDWIHAVAHETNTYGAVAWPVRRLVFVRSQRLTQARSDGGGRTFALARIQDRWAGSTGVTPTTASLVGATDTSLSNSLIDSDRQYAGKIRASLDSDATHTNGIGYTLYGAELTKWVAAKNGGPVYIPFNELYAKIASAAGAGTVVLNIPYVGTLSSCTYRSLDSRFTVVANGTALELRLTGSDAFTADYNDIQIEVTKAGYAPVTYTTRVSISRRGTAPAFVQMTGRNRFMEPKGSTVADATKLTLVWIGGFAQDSADLFASPSADARTQRIIDTLGGSAGVSGLIFERASFGQYRFIVRDTAGSNICTLQGGARGVTSGIHAVFANIDLGTGLAKMFVTNGASNAVEPVPASGNATITGNGTIMLNGTNRVDLFSPLGLGTSFFNGTKGLLWVASDYNANLDFSIAGNRAKFFNDTTRAMVDLGAAGTVEGVTPFLYLPGDAAELYMGSDSGHSGDYGGRTTKNHGTGGDFLYQPGGRMTTV